MRCLEPIDVGRMPSVERLRVPQGFCSILDAPRRLAGMIRPSDRTPRRSLAWGGFHFIFCLADDVLPYGPPSIELLHAARLENPCGRIRPTDQESEAKKVLVAVDRAADALWRGTGVIVHCAGGAGRTGTVIGGVLCRCGHLVDDVNRYLNGVHSAAPA